MENDIEVNQGSHSSLQVPRPPFSSLKDIGFAEDMNPRHRRTNEDGHCMIDKFRGKEGEGFFAIYDGHGGRGAVNIVQNSFHNIFENELNFLESKNTDGTELIDVTQAYNSAYSRMDGELKVQEILYNGATSITCYIRYMPKMNKRFLYVANCGDARVVITKKTGQAERLTYDHKASDEGEVKRIKAKNGFVAYNRVNGVLSVTRSFGDHAMKEWVISDPYHSFVDLTDGEYDYLVLACDGVWDVISDQDSSNFIHENSHMNCQQLSELILKKSLSLGSTDNISVIIVKL
ncbi:phosphatase [Naegleria gruberi]|uniref:Phosphatase n=1 Tax=Naegleria gruberi TaxID=5762 RepID=D2VLS9_NAEGR|nr:phosphatase [Naegleria gruberi]EFC42107.1 phosphatase [Naegleria gruberi]|eukprot:XP_002674851.1 phosphatase [Naegleria gruberi]